MKSIQYAIIGGTGVYDSGVASKKVSVQTEFGEIEVDIAEVQGNSVVFLARHGKQHGIPPHRINYRANLKGLQKLGVKQVFATAAVGSLNPDFPKGSLVLLADFLDMTKQRPLTFFEGDSEGAKHVNMDDPYCRNLRQQLTETAIKHKVHFTGDAVYICTEGPRFETEAEIKMMRQWGADVVGMTSVPEVVLAKELGICYASVGFVVNMATGMDIRPIQMAEIEKMVSRNKEIINQLVLGIFSKLPDQQNCACSDSIVYL
jgi:5'-methylthioadenosine phosphorylase